jgi:hypothetical protein
MLSSRSSERPISSSALIDCGFFYYSETQANEPLSGIEVFYFEFFYWFFIGISAKPWFLSESEFKFGSTDWFLALSGDFPLIVLVYK